jgi:serine-type D-Ala-D-Ala carboxypeptidase (penicillin-binding protein 5/6)
MLALAALVLAGASLVAWRAWPSAGPSVQPAAAKPPAPTRSAATTDLRRPAPALLAVRRPLAHGVSITAPAGILVDRRTGTVLWAKRPHLRRPIASTTKIMTAVVALRRLPPLKVVVVDPSVPRVQPFKEGLRAGERVPAWKLFYGLLLFSGNDDAMALAIAAGGTWARFVALMNEKARALGLRDTHFRSVSGLIDRDNYSTAWDLAALARYAMWNRRFRKVVGTRVKHVTWAHPTYAKIYVNHNHLLGTYPGADGVKTGWTTRAKHCLVASAHRRRVQLIAVVLGSADPYGDAKKLLNYGFASRG